MDDIEQAMGQQKDSAMKTNPMVMILAAILLVASGCASIDVDYPRGESYSPIVTGDSYLGQLTADKAGKHPDDHAGFLPMSDGTDALAARLLLMSRAEQSINAQYYLIRDDVVGRAFMKALLDAADRGVFVRLLVDDMYIQNTSIRATQCRCCTPSLSSSIGTHFSLALSTSIPDLQTSTLKTV